MNEIFTLVILGLIGLSIGLLVHELTHYLFSRAFGGNPRLYCRYKLPRGVSLDHGNLSSTGIRVAGGGTIVYPILLVIYLLTVGPPPTDTIHIFHYLTFIALITSSGFSPTDMLCLISPSEFREYSKKESEGLWDAQKQALSHIRMALSE